MPASPLRTLVAVVVAALIMGVVPPAASAAQSPTTTTLQAPAGPIGIFDPLSFLALVRPSPDDGGTVTLVENGVGLVDDEITPNGAANLSLPNGLTAGTHTLNAVFNGTTSSAPSTSDDLVLEVVDDRTPVTVTLESDGSPSLRGEPVGLRVTVSPDPGDGNVQIVLADDGGIVTLPVPIGPGGVTDIAWTPTATFDYPLRACFSGNVDFGEACSSTIVQSVFAHATTTSLVILPDEIYQDETVMFRVTVDPPPEIEVSARVGVGPFDGWFVGIDPATGVGEVTLDPFIVRTEVGVGSHELSAFYPGSPNTDPSQSDAMDLDVVIDPTATTAVVNPRAIRIGETATIGVSVAPSPVDLPLVAVSVDHPTLADWLVEVDLDAAGTGSVEFDSTGWREGVYDVTTTFGGTDRLAGSTHTTSITIDSTAPAGSVSIAGGAANTLTTAVTVGVPASDALSGVTQVELSNNGSTWTTRAYAASQAWTLTTGVGTKTVYARWKDAAGNRSAASADTIFFGVPTPTPPPDITPPTGSISIAGGAAYTRTRFVTVATPATDDSGHVTEMALSNDGITWTTGGYAPMRHWALEAIDGTRTVHVKWKDAAGNWSAVETDTIVLDTVKPSVTVPLRSFVVGSGIDAGRISVRVPWSASDDKSGIARYELEQSTGGVWAMVSTTLTSPSITRLLATQQDYQFRVRAVDGAGNTSVATGKPFRISRYSEHNSAIRYNGSWTNDANPAYWGGAARRSSTAGARASLTFTGRHIAWVARTGPDRGKAGIFVNGTQVATVDLYSPTTRAQRVVWVGSWSTSVSRTVTIRVAGTTGRPRIDLDALVTAN